MFFSDEATVQIMDERHQFVRCRLGELLPNCVEQSIKHSDKIMVWSVISWKDAGPLHVLNVTMQKEQYIQVLVSCLFPEMKERYPEKYGTFIQDCA
jgi:hypothetical protein